jgi:predicted SAM-dependent methyltransferase
MKLSGPGGSSPAEPRAGAGARLHVGCGRERLAGWVNIDFQAYPGVDVVADVTQGLEFREAEAVYAEHFLEHLRIDQALAFLVECHRALGEGGLIRLSTPNLDWVWITHYALEAETELRQRMDLHLNRAFYGWEHRFVWNRPLLARALEACGFTRLEWPVYGESRHPIFRGIERHEAYPDAPELPHVLIVEAEKGAPAPAALEALRRFVQAELLDHLKG